jgi:hypothetical protein
MGVVPISSQRFILTGASATAVASPFAMVFGAVQSTTDGLPFMIGEILVQQTDANGNVKRSYAVADPATITVVPQTAFGVQIDAGYANQDTALVLGNPASTAVTVTVTLYNGDGDMPRSQDIYGTAQISLASGASISKTISEIFAGNSSYENFLKGMSGAESLAIVTSTIPINVGVVHIDLNPDGTTVYTPAFAFPLSYSSPVDPAFVGSMAQIASGGGYWETMFTLVNTSSTLPATAMLNFIGDDGSPLSLPLLFPQTGETITASSVYRTIPAGGELLVTLADSGSTAVTGSAILSSTTGNVSGFAIFRYDPSGQEAVVPLETRNSPSYILPYDNTGTLQTGIAIANVSSSPASIPVIIRDDTGGYLGTATLQLPAQGHESFFTYQGFPVTAGKRGTLEFDTPAGGQISVLGLRWFGQAWTTIPISVP